MKRFPLFFVLLSLAIVSCANTVSSNSNQASVADPDPSTYNAVAVFAGGCFWCTEAIFERVNGVSEVISGYSGGIESTANYKDVCSATTKHAEAIEIYYNSDVVSYATLVNAFLKGGHDATQLNRQGPDIGPQYRSAIFYSTEAERKIVTDAIAKIDAEGYYDAPIVTEVAKLEAFYAAEDYHQDYYKLNPNQSYVYNVSRPKVEKFVKLYPELLKPEFQIH